MADHPVLTELLDLHNLRVVHYQLVGSERINLFVENTLAMAVCPDCEQVSVEVHETGEPQMVRDLSILGRRCWLHYAPRRFKCSRCGDTFVERVDWKEPGLSYTVRYERHVYQRTRREAITQVAEDEGLSEEAVQGIFERWAQKTVETRGYPLVKVLCVDEVALHKGHGNYVLVISAPKLGVILDVLEDRSKERLEAWFDARGKAWCEYVEVACSDMWDTYQQTFKTKLPNAYRVVDRFHIMKNLNDALTKARRSIQNQADEATKAVLKGCRWLLVKNREDLKDEERQKLDAMLTASPELKTCYELKESFRNLFNQPLDVEAAEQALLEWIAKVEASGFKALAAFVNTLRNWWVQVLNYFKGRHSNGFAEGVNLKIKMINRRGYGYRNFKQFRLHVLVAFDPVSR